MNNSEKFEKCAEALEAVQATIDFMHYDLHFYTKVHQAAFVEITLALTDSMKLLDYDAWCVYYEAQKQKMDEARQALENPGGHAIVDGSGKNIGQYL